MGGGGVNKHIDKLKIMVIVFCKLSCEIPIVILASKYKFILGTWKIQV